MGVLEPNRVEQSLIQRLRAAFEDAGWTVERAAPGEHDPDLVVSRPGITYVVEFRASQVARRSMLQALLADAILRARAATRRRANDRTRPLAVVGAPVLTPAMIESLREYARVVAPDDAYGWIDGTGRAELVGEGLEHVRARLERFAPPVVKPPVVRTIHDLFTDLSQWLLKVLIAPRLPERLLSAPRVPVRNARELARVAQVSVPSAARFLSALEAEHHVVREHGLHATRIPALLGSWRIAVRRSALEMPMRWILPPADAQARIAELVRSPFQHLKRQEAVEERDGFLYRSVQWERGPRMCLGLFSACDAMGFGIVRGVPRHVYMDPFDPELLRKFGLSPAEGADRVDVVVRKPRFPEAVFRSAVSIGDVPASDVIQAWLDVADHPARGSEQARHLWDRAILPHVNEEQVR